MICRRVSAWGPPMARRTAAAASCCPAGPVLIMVASSRWARAVSPACPAWKASSSRHWEASSPWMLRVSSSAVTWWASRSPSWRRPGRCSRSTAAHTRASGRTAAPPDRASSTASATMRILVLAVAGLGPGQPQHGHHQLLPLPGIPGRRWQGIQLGQGRGGHLVGGGGVAEGFQAADQPDLHAGQPAAIGQVTTDVMGGLAGHHPLHQPRPRISGQRGRLAQHRRGQLPPVRRRQGGHQPGHPGIRRAGQPHQRPGPHHPPIIVLSPGAQHLQCLARPGGHAARRPPTPAPPPPPTAASAPAPPRPPHPPH